MIGFVWDAILGSSMIEKIVPVILCGGLGSRLWPLSTVLMPKQFLSIGNIKRSLFQKTLDRVRSDSFFTLPLIVSNRSYLSVLQEQIRELGKCEYLALLENEPKNTTVSITLAAFYIKQYFGSDALTLFLPSDHYMKNEDNLKNEDNFLKAIQAAATRLKVSKDNIMLFGVTPKFAESNYGYIKCKQVSEFRNLNKTIYQVESFIEKPAHEITEKYFQEDGYFWNSGIYMASARTILQKVESCESRVYFACKQIIEKCDQQNNVINLDVSKLEGTPLSFDKSVTEKLKNLEMKVLDAVWYDVGSWGVIRDVFKSCTK